MTTDDYRSVILKPLSVEIDVNELRGQLEKGSERAKIEAMKNLLNLTANGDFSTALSLLMHVIRFVLPGQKNKLLKKLVLLYFEMVPTRDSEGRLRQEMILVCNALRQDLQHPNEYMRGVTLRFVCRLHDAELIEPLIPEHRHPYVRRNAIVAVSFIHGEFPELISDAPEVIETLLAGGEGDGSVLRAAFVALSQAAPERALAFILHRHGEYVALPVSLQLAMVELIQRHPSAAQGLDNCLLSFLGNGFAPVVRLEACSALLRLSPNPPLSLLRQLATSLVEICRAESDSGAKLLILSRLQQLQATSNAGKQMDELAVDVLRLLGSPDLEVKRRVVELCLSSLSNRVALEVVNQLMVAYRQALQESPGNEELHTLLLHTLRRIIQRRQTGPVVAMLPALLEGCCQTNSPRLVIRAGRCLKEAMELLEEGQRATVLPDLLQSLGTFAHPMGAQALLWVIAEYAQDPKQAFESVIGLLGPLPIEDSDHADADAHVQSYQVNQVLPDGTYQSTVVTDKHRQDGLALRHAFLRPGSSSLAASIGACLIKLVLRGYAQGAAKAMLAITSLIRAGQSLLRPPMDRDSVERLLSALKAMSNPAQSKAWMQECHQAFLRLLAAEDQAGRKVVPPTEAIKFRQLAIQGDEAPQPLADDLPLALQGNSANQSLASDGLARVVQLTGHSDLIYAESIITVNHGNVLLDLLLVNQTPQAILNLSLDLTATGELQVVERPPPVSLSAHGFAILKASVRVRATDCGTIGGCLGWGTVNPQTVVLSSVTLDILDYLEAPSATGSGESSLDGKHGCNTDHEFRQEWTLLEWENRILLGPLGSPTTNLASLFESILTSCRLRCLTPSLGLSEGGDFLAANVVGRSLFGEEILGNICLERGEEGVQGVARLRSQSSGLVRSMGQKLNEVLAKN